MRTPHVSNTPRNPDAFLVKSWSAILALALVAGGFASSAAATHGSHAVYDISTLEVAYAETVQGNGAWGILIDLPEPGRWAITVTPAGERTSSAATIGFGRTAADGWLQWMDQFATVVKPDGSVEGMQYWVGSETGRTRIVGEHCEATAPCASTYLVYNYTGDSARLLPAGTFRFIAWGGGWESTSIEIRASTGATVDVASGTSYVLGDREFAGDGNVFVHESTTPGQYVGVEGIRDASFPVSVQHRLYGAFWQVDEKRVYAGDPTGVEGSAVWVPWPIFLGMDAQKGVIDEVTGEVCRGVLGVNCNNVQMSWDGPSGSSDGRTDYRFMNGAPGEYSFNVDLKVDAYSNHWLGESKPEHGIEYPGAGLGAPEARTSMWAALPESHVIMSVVDVAVPEAVA